MGDPWNGILKFFECKVEINQQIATAQRVDEKNGVKMFKKW